MRKNARIFIIVLAFLLIVVLAFGIFSVAQGQRKRQAQEQYWQNLAEDIQKHKKIWADQGITNYRIEIHMAYTRYCSLELVVSSNVIRQVIKDDCYYSNFGTVDSLFSIMQNMVDEKRCGSNGCGCDGPFHIDAVYDEQYGFPKAGRAMIHPQQRWRYGTQTFCTMLLTLGIGWDVYSFTPLTPLP